MNKEKGVWKCPECGSVKIEQVTSGYRVSNVVGVSLDDGLVCGFLEFVPNKDALATYHRCKNCRAVLPFESAEALIKFLREE